MEGQQQVTETQRPQDAYTEAARDFITSYLRVDQHRYYEHASPMRVDDSDSGNPVVAVTVKFVSQALIYEVWEVIFSDDGHGVFGKVATSGYPGTLLNYQEGFAWKAESYVPDSILIGTDNKEEKSA